ncbi:hypothetical protein [Cellulosimicrobium cellulans]|uniref:hypothetical protein n=1 Tax=Cellulosimicrobium cellulans TaxID=1710 RepID=UPI00084892DA|nr:hypothetical protein [Cellulosimicrobium cellulans]
MRRADGVTTAVLLVVAVAAGAVAARVDAWWPTLTATTTRGAAGDVVTAGPVRVRVDDVRTGSTLVAGWAGDELTTGGAWVAVDLALSGTDADANVAVMELRDAHGRDHASSTRTTSDLVGRFVAPDVPQRGTVVFEVPERALDGDLVLRVLTESQDADVDRPQAVAEVDLGRLDAPAPGAVVEPLETEVVPGGWDA